MNDFLSNYQISNTSLIQIGISLLLVLLYWIARKIISKIVRNRAIKNSFVKTRIAYMTKVLYAVSFIVLLLLLSIVWNFSVRGLAVYFATFFTIVGVGFFAQWSILSNITASAIIYFQHPFRIGDQIRIFDGDNSLEGEVLDIGAFWLQIQVKGGEHFFYPNNMAITKPIFRIKK